MFKLIAYIIDYIAYKRDKRIDKIIAIASLKPAKEAKKGDRICLRHAHDMLITPQGKIHSVVLDNGVINMCAGRMRMNYLIDPDKELWIIDN